MRRHSLRDVFRLAPVLSSAGPIAGAVSACTGGVCTVAAPAVGSLFTASLSSGAGLTQLLGNSSAVTTLTTTVPTFPAWNLASMALLVATFAWDIWLFARLSKPWYAVALTLSLLVLLAGESWRLPLPHLAQVQWASLAIGLPAFLALPWRDSLSARGTRWLLRILLLGGAGALLGVFSLQWFSGMVPCPLCWLERGWLVATILLAFFPNTRNFSFLGALGGLLTAAWQYLETSHSVQPLSVCTQAVSCIHAGETPLFGLPMVDWALGGFSVLLTLAILAKRKGA